MTVCILCNIEYVYIIYNFIWTKLYNKNSICFVQLIIWPYNIGNVHCGCMNNERKKIEQKRKEFIQNNINMIDPVTNKQISLSKIIKRILF